MEELREYISDYGIATDEEVTLVVQINGYSLDSLESILYARTGYEALEQIKDGEDEDDE